MEKIGLVGVGAMGSAILERLRNNQVDVLDRWQERFDETGSDPMPRAGTNMFDKDLPLAATVARQLGLELPITKQLDAAAEQVVAASRTKSKLNG